MPAAAASASTWASAALVWALGAGGASAVGAALGLLRDSLATAWALAAPATARALTGGPGDAAAWAPGDGESSCSRGEGAASWDGGAGAE